MVISFALKTAKTSKYLHNINIITQNYAAFPAFLYKTYKLWAKVYPFPIFSSSCPYLFIITSLSFLYLYYVPIFYLLCHYLFFIMSLSFLYPIPIFSLPNHYLFFIMSISFLYPFPIFSLSYPYLLPHSALSWNLSLAEIWKVSACKMGHEVVCLSESKPPTHPPYKWLRETI